VKAFRQRLNFLEKFAKNHVRLRIIIKKLIFSPLIKGDTLDRSRKRRSVLEKDTSKKVAAVKRKDPRAEYAGWYAMYANEKNAAKGKLSYTRYNFYKKINFKEKIKVMEEGSEENGDSNETVMFSAYLDKDLTIPLTEKNSRVGEEIQMWFPWPESKTLENPVELNDSGDVQETVTIPPHFHRARLTYFSSDPPSEKSEDQKAAECFNYIFGTSKSAYHMKDKDAMSKMLKNLLVHLEENDIVDQQEKNHKLKNALRVSDRAGVAAERKRLMQNLIRKSVVTKHGIEDILGIKKESDDIESDQIKSNSEMETS